MISLFVSLNGKKERYEKARVTPYMQIMVTLIPKFFEPHNSVKIFTGQGVRKNNDVGRVIILQQEQHQWELKEHLWEVCSTRRATGMLKVKKTEKRPK